MERTKQPLEHRRPVDARPPTGSRGRGNGPHLGPVRITPTRVVLLVALVGSLAYLAFAITVRDASQIPMLSSGAAVLGIVFGALAVLGAVATYRAGVDGRSGQAFTLAVLGGVAAMIAAGCFAAAIVLGLVLQV
jgi:hypothetical protein